ncbi:MAG: hypothetical protein P0S96_05090 [Simkaniaceae bacterium]|nr:hypothetical protein [Candidatus Sacchlamyda saccharinae]
MEHPKDPYHVRPFPQQPHRGGKELKSAIADLESALGESVPDFERLRAIQARIHEKVNTYNDDRLVDMIRQISNNLEAYQEKPERAILEKILKQILKVRVELKHL